MPFNLKGLEGLQAQLKSIAEETRPKLLRSAMRAAFKPVLEDAKARVPVDSGALREGITLASAKVKGQPSISVVGLAVISNSTRHKQALMAAAAFGEAQARDFPPGRRWHFPELGTAHHAPQPFLRPALHANQQGVIDSMSREVQKKIRRALKKGGKR